LKTTVRRASEEILDEASKRVMDGMVTNIYQALRSSPFAKGLPHDVVDDGDSQNLFVHIVFARVSRELCFDPEIRTEKSVRKIAEIAIDYYNDKIRKFGKQYAERKNRYIEAVAKEKTHELIDYLETKASLVRSKVTDRLARAKSHEVNVTEEEREDLDFFKALKLYAGKDRITAPINDFSTDKCTKWLDLLLLIVWHKVSERLADGNETDFKSMSATVLKEIRQWEQAIKDRAG
jgi:hypothetical protein